MQSFSARSPDHRPRLLVTELWGLGDVALAIPFLRTAAAQCRVTLLAKAHAAPLVQRFCPEVELVPLTAPWTAHRGKYRLHRWPWSALQAAIAGLHRRGFAAAVSARPDPRDHLLLALSGAGLRAGFPRLGSHCLLTDPLAPPTHPHRAAHWAALAAHFGWPAAEIPGSEIRPPPSPLRNHIVIHTGAAQPTRAWPRERFAALAGRLHQAGWRVTVLDADTGGLVPLVAMLATADRFIGNDSGPGHVAALLGVPTFTIFGAQLSENFHPVHPRAAWIEGTPCPYKPCHDRCHYENPRCITSLLLGDVWARLQPWLAA